MHIELETSTLSLPLDGMIALRDAQGTRVACLSGALWITEDHELGDTILEAGQHFTLRRPGLTLVMALQPASLQLQEREQREALGSRFARWLSRLLPVGVRPAIG